MYSYAKQQRLDILKMEFREAYIRWQERINKVDNDGRHRLAELETQYKSRWQAMRDDSDSIIRMHAQNMDRINARLASVADALRVARDKDRQNNGAGGGAC